MPKKQNVTNRQFQQFLIYVGCSFKRSKGDHFVYVRPDLLRPVIVPKDNPIPQFIVRNNLKLLGMSWEEFFNIIDRM
ncbi:MAG: hypothetical protein US45_C0030G0007 [Candidatus Nomurabacteria bacterium GW2011_GWA1_37_20]|uniref:YcfA family protein n=2 Tax=Parcubacteria group TaxID=1794811 RepID=A0A0G0KAS6_9BACT|nr:MAG: hypothetical protein US41_C0026G0002 [Parcubacteria group bacterium GW2011_GWB1_37_13]KKQ32081.1 MAG: hypothetical protein US45_C0030G0007 [Candidatus Nomurabacteria bacterium GW2011_GWA1_37_20]KKQ46224.1 MAG: hypothetical protein US65_C0043G0012 [Candidatus Yanofskybacteria bacterium GW2011_GWC2_37_9]